MPRYRIKPGGSFRMPDGQVKTVDDEIDLDTDVAAMHASVLEQLPDQAAAGAGDAPNPDTPE
jgi:hypothetical protein